MVHECAVDFRGESCCAARAEVCELDEGHFGQFQQERAAGVGHMFGMFFVVIECMTLVKLLQPDVCEIDDVSFNALLQFVVETSFTQVLSEELDFKVVLRLLLLLRCIRVR